jgi:hypothetical protein
MASVHHVQRQTGLGAPGLYSEGVVVSPIHFSETALITAAFCWTL